MMADQLRTTFRTLFQLKSSSGRNWRSGFLAGAAGAVCCAAFLVGTLAGAVVGILRFVHAARFRTFSL